MGYNSIAAGAGLYMGSVGTSSRNDLTAMGGATEDSYGGGHQSGGRRFVYNAFNRLIRMLGVIDTTSSWSYGTATWRPGNNNNNNKIEYLCGLAIEDIKASLFVGCSSLAGIFGGVGIGVDSTSVNSAKNLMEMGNVAINSLSPAFYNGVPGLGYHSLTWLEYGRSGGSTTFFGNPVVTILSGLIVEIWG